ncbi:MAG: hypothetical protein KDA75_00095 [Planctomycetaceae bacterium]|nr:hypothetical protein [Planctomycetaceae bacterium]
MGARQRLNSLYLAACLLFAAVVGGVADSWVLFLLVAGVSTGLLIYDGGIRPNPTHRGSRSRRRR